MPKQVNHLMVYRIYITSAIQQGYVIDLFSCKRAWISRALLKSGKAATIILTISRKPGNHTLRGKISFKGKPRVKNACNEYL